MTPVFVTSGVGGGTGATAGSPISYDEMLALATAADGTEFRLIKDGVYGRDVNGLAAFPNATAANGIVITGANEFGVVDGDRPTIRINEYGIVALQAGTPHLTIANLIFDGNEFYTSNCLWLSVNYTHARNVKCVGNTVSRGIYASAAYCTAVDCEFDGIFVTAALDCEGLTVIAGRFHGGTKTAVRAGTGTRLIGCAIWNNTGATTDGVEATGNDLAVIGGAIAGNGRHGINFGTALGNATVMNVATYDNAGDNFHLPSYGAGVRLLGCAGGGSAADYNPALVNPANVVGFVTLASNPFRDSANGDFTPDDVNGGPLLGAGYVGTLPGATESVPNIGLSQTGAGPAPDYPPAGTVIATTVYGDGAYTGTYVPATAGQIESGVSFGPGGTLTGTLEVAGPTLSQIWGYVDPDDELNPDGLTVSQRLGTAEATAKAVWLAGQSVNNVPGSMGARLNGVNTVDYARAVWDEPRSAHVASGTFGAYLQDDPKYSGTVVSATPSTVTLPPEVGAAVLDEWGVVIDSGPGDGQYRVLSNYDPETFSGSVDRAWSPQPTNESTFILVPPASLSRGGLDTVDVEDGVNLRKAMGPVLGAAAGQISNATSSPVLVKNPAGTATRAAIGVDGAGNRTSVALTLRD